MSSNCPNCGSGETEKPDEQPHRCVECGTQWWLNNSSKPIMVWVPTRSRPAEVLELPDAEGCWWTVERKMYIEVFLDGGKRPYSFSRQGVRCYCPTGRYVRCVLPVIAPAKPEPDPDPDAELLRTMGDVNYVHDSVTHRALYRIAADLERLRREAKEAGR